jgi:hypothetical protein
VWCIKSLSAVTNPSFFFCLVNDYIMFMPFVNFKRVWFQESVLKHNYTFWTLDFKLTDRTICWQHWPRRRRVWHGLWVTCVKLYDITGKPCVRGCGSKKCYSMWRVLKYKGWSKNARARFATVWYFKFYCETCDPLGQCCKAKNTWNRNKKLVVVEFTFSHSLQCH